MSAGREQGSGAWRPGALAALPALAALAAALGVLRLDFVPYDDPLLLTRNPLVQHPTPAHLLRLWTGPLCGDYHPLTLTLYAAEWAAFGPVAWPYHAVSALLHALSTALVALLLRAHLGPNRAVAAALAFAVHPLAVEPVAWVASQKDALMLPLLLGAVLLARRGAGGSGAAWAGSLALGAAALLAKSQAVVLPLLVAWDLQALARRAGERLPPRTTWPWLGAHLALAAGGAALKLEALAQVGAAPALPPPGGVWGRIDLVALTLGAYLGHALWPVGLHPVYRLPSAPWHLVAWLGVGAAGALAWSQRRARPALSWGLGWALLAVLPGAQLVLYPLWAADRYAYPALVGVAAAAAALVLGPGRPSRARRLSWALLLGLLAQLSCAQQGLWRDGRALWAGTLARDPDHVQARIGLARALTAEGSAEAARGLLEQALSREPDDPRVTRLLGELAWARGELDEAEAWLRRPAAAHAAPLARLLRARGRREEAAALVAEALPRQPHLPELRRVAAWLELDAGRPQAAADQLQAALEADPGQVEDWLLLARTLASLDQHPAAAAALREAEQLGAAPLLLELERARCAWLAGDRAAAKAALEAALALEPTARAGLREDPLLAPLLAE